MAHIHTKPGQHDHTASAYIVRMDFDEAKLMLHMHKKLGTYLQFGGHIELDEDPWQALKHELQEESGYPLDQLELLQPKNVLSKLTGAKLHPTPVSYITVPFDETHNHTDISYALLAKSGPPQNVGENESNQIVLFTRQELTSLPNSEIFDNVREIGLFIFDTCLSEWERVSPAKFD